MRSNRFGIPAGLSIFLLLIALVNLLAIGGDVFAPSGSRSVTQGVRRPSQYQRQLSSYSRSFHVENLRRRPIINLNPTTSASQNIHVPIADSSIETSPRIVPSPPEQVAFRTRSGPARRDAGTSQPSNITSSNVTLKPTSRLLLYAANDEEGVFIKDMQQFSSACYKHLGGRSQVDVRFVIGDIGLEFSAFFKQTTVRMEDMFIFGVSGHGIIRNNLVSFNLSENLRISIRDVFKAMNSLPPHCTIEVFLDVCHAARAAEQHGLCKIWPVDELSSGSNLNNSAAPSRVGPKMILWTAKGVAYFETGQNSYMLKATRKALKSHGQNISRIDLYEKTTKRLEPLNRRLKKKNKELQSLVIFSTVPDRDRVLNGYALQPLLLGNEHNGA